MGVRMPLVRQSHRHHRAHSQKHRKREREKDALPAEHGYHCESCWVPAAALPGQVPGDTL